jgi:4-amino-4-deoxychorismate lyase
LDQASALGLQVVVDDLWPADLAQADEVFVCNSVYGIWPVRAFASLRWSAGPLTRKLQGIAHTLLDA